jgi:hypothetical protein
LTFDQRVRVIDFRGGQYMKLLSAVFLATLLCVGLAHASITPLEVGTSTSGADTVFNYEISVDNNETLDTTGCAAVTESHGSCTYFTIDNFQDYAGAINAPSPNWEAFGSASGVETFVYIGPLVTGTGAEITGFNISSTLSSQPAGAFTYQTGNTNIPPGVDIGGGTLPAFASTPEPTSLSLFGGGLIGLAILVRRKFARS